MSDADLIAHHDHAAPHTEVGTQWFVAELRHREIARRTKALVVLTVIIGVLTAVKSLWSLPT